MVGARVGIVADPRPEDNAFYTYLKGISWDYFQGMDMPKYLKSIEKVDT